MLVSATPIPIDLSHVRLNMPCASAPAKKSSSTLMDILKFVIGLLIALIFGGILVVMIFFPRSVDLRESNENIAKLERQSNENLAQLSREQQLSIEQQRQKQQNELMKQKIDMEKERLVRLEKLIKEKIELEEQRAERQENRAELYRAEERSQERQRREEDLYLAKNRFEQQLEIEQKRLQIEVQKQALTEQHRKEDLHRENIQLEIDFVKRIFNWGEGWSSSEVEFEIQLLIRQLDTAQKSLLINDLYKLQLINGGETALDLTGADLKEIDMDNVVDDEIDTVTDRLNYSGLSLPSTNLINASFQNIIIQDANFESCQMLGVLFHWSNVQRTNFNQSILSLASFRAADLTECYFSNAKIDRAAFSSALLTRALMINATLESANFEYASAVETDFSRSQMSSANFQNAFLQYARFDDVVGQSINFYFAKAMEASFTRVYMPSCVFVWTDLTNASFRNAYLAGALFDNAIVVNVDFTRAFLTGATLTQEQLDVALSIANAHLPDGSLGKNKNLVRNGDAQCSGMPSSINDWFAIQNVIVTGNQSSNECVFQSTAADATFLQMVDIGRYRRLIEKGLGNIYVELNADSNVNTGVYVMLRYFDDQQFQIGPES